MEHLNWPAASVEMRPIAQLTPYVNNARTHSDAQIEQIAASMREWGWTNPVLVDEAGMIIAGHGRILAAQKLGFAEVPVMTAAGWTEAQKQAYVIADNQLALNAGWDMSKLAVELTDLTNTGFDVNLLGFSPQDLQRLTGKADGLTDPDEVPEAPASPTAKIGDVWLLGPHRLVCGDSTQESAVRAALAGEKPNLMVTDPPYGVEYDPKWRAEAGVNKNKAKMGLVKNDDRADWREAWALFPGGVAYVWHADRHASEVQASLEACEFDVRSQIIWAKDRMALSRGHYHWQHEPCWYAVRKGATGNWCGDRSQTTLWNIKSRDDSGQGHGTQKPVECMKRPIENNSNPGEHIYEPFSGSGTTIIACEMTGRVCHAIELDPAYVDVAVKRWELFTGKQAVLESSDGDRGAQAQADAPEADNRKSRQKAAAG